MITNEKIIVCISIAKDDVDVSFGISKFEGSRYKLFLKKTRTDKTDMPSLCENYTSKEICVTEDENCKWVYLPNGNFEEISLENCIVSLKRVNKSVILESAIYDDISTVAIDGLYYSEVPF